MANKLINSIINANSASIKRSQAYAEQVRKMFAETVNEILELQKSIPELEEGQMFSFDAQPIRIQKEVEVLLRRLSATATLATQNGIKVEWDKANDSADALLSSVMGKAVLRNPHFSAWTNRNQTAMQNFINRKEGIMTLSDRIWQSTRQLREEMEVALTVGIGEGKSSAQISRDVRKYLNDPDLMFRRFRYKIDEDENGNPIYGRKWKKLVKDEDGKKHWIDYDKDDYKVGAGMYKSSAKNAMRVARTETNMAYKRADQERYKKFDFIVGYHIEPSRNHEPEDCEPDICEQLKGDYPKWFTWEGWHPQCKCQCTPIMMDEDEAIAMFNAKAKGKKYTPKGMINEMPQQFKDWCEDNKEKIVKSHQRGKDPYFVRHNFDVVKQAIKGEEITVPKIELNSKNRELYEKIKADKEFRNVEYNEINGGLKAESVHHNSTSKEDKFFMDENNGKGYSGNELEKFCQEELFKTGHSCLLMEEGIPKSDGTFFTALDAIIDGKRMDIKSITENTDSYRNRITSKNKQLAKWRKQTGRETEDSLCLYFHKPELFSDKKIETTKEQLKSKLKDKNFFIRKLYCVIRGADDMLIFDLDK